MRQNVYFLERGSSRYNLSDKWRLVDIGGLGLLQPEYVTQGNSQLGERVLSFKIPPRIVTMQLHHKAAVDQSGYWRNRAELFELLSPTSSTQLKFVAHLANGQRRSLDVRYDNGAQFDGNREQKSSRHLSIPLSLISHDALFYDPFAVDYEFTASPPSELSFPFDFPKTFDGEGSSFDTPDLEYDGFALYKSYPILTATGPFTSVVFTNTATGISITLTANVASGESRIITLGENRRTVLDGDGNNRFYEIVEGSNLIDFYIVANAGATQTISASFTGEDGTSTVSLSFYRRFLGL